ncbi:MAG: hypothetical protein E2O41_03285 [Nitrospina sp.]|nr:MAG: hypothetical protein E2O41_03285 [Nitrospina sp.]
MLDDRYILKFKAATGFVVVLEYKNSEELAANQKKIEEAGISCERLQGFSFNFDQSDLYMDMRSPECIEQFDLDDWI